MTVTIWNESTREELRTVLPEALVVLPTGATEQHGLHLPTGHDSFTVAEVAAKAAERSSANVVLAPPLVFGSSDHHLLFGGTLSLSTDTYYRVVRELVESMLSCGARKIFLLNGHGGNQELNQLVARDVAVVKPEDSGIAVAAASYWQIAEASLASDPALAGIPVPGHAGNFETSTMLAMEPARVREPRPVRESDPSVTLAIPGVRIESTGWWAGSDGFTGFPHLATAELGERMLDHVIRDVAAAFDAFGA